MGTVSALLPTGPQCHTRTFALHPNRLMLPGGPMTMLPEELSTGDCVCGGEGLHVEFSGWRQLLFLQLSEN